MGTRRLGFERLERRELMSVAAGDRILFAGDSITYHGTDDGGYVALVDEDTTVEILSSGAPGETLSGLSQRLPSVLALEPTTLVIYSGINDVWWANTSYAAFEFHLRNIVAQTRQAGVEPALCTLGVIGEVMGTANPFNAKLDQYSAIVRQVAADTGSEVIDLRAAFVAYLNGHNPKRQTEDILTHDGVHLNGPGNAFVAEHAFNALTGAPINDPPCLSLTLDESELVDYFGSPVQLAPLANIHDFDDANFGGGTLRAEFFDPKAKDQLRVLFTGGITTSGRTVLFKGVPIGEIAIRAAVSDPLIISLNENASQCATQALVRAVAYRSLSATPAPGIREVVIELDDGSAAARPKVVGVNVAAMLAMSQEIEKRRRT